MLRSLAAGRGLRARLARVAVLVIVTVAALQSSPAEQRVRVVLRLLEARYGARSLAAVPIATVGGVQRPVLSGAPSETLVRLLVPASDRGPRTVVVTVPERLRGGPLRLIASVGSRPFGAGAGAVHPDGWLAESLDHEPLAPVADLEPRVVSSAKAEERLGITPGGPAFAGNTPLVVVGRTPSEPRYTTEPFVVPRGARLRFGSGVAETDWSAPPPPVSFTVTAVTDHGEQTLFHAGLDPARNPAERRWLDHEVALPPDDVVRLRFETTGGWTGGDAPFTFPVWSDPVVVAPEPRAAAPKRRNLLLISLDTLRADHLGCYGYSRPTSPTIDAELAGRGTLFERAYTSFPSTEGAHMTLFTSLDPCVHGVSSPFAPPLRADALTLAEMLRAEDYDTAAFTEDGLMTSAFGFARGFGTFVEDRRGAGFASIAETTFQRALEWIRRPRQSPWFVFVHTYQVHSPYASPPGYLDKMAWDRQPATLGKAAYDAAIRYTDDVLAGFLAVLDATGASDDTLVVVVGDHGEQFGEHGKVLHGNSLYDVLLHVPLIVRAPGLVPARKRIPAPVGLVDVVPTVLDLLDLPPPVWSQGRSLRPLLHDLPAGEDRVLYAQMPDSPVFAARDGSTKLLVDPQSGRTETFQLAADPLEERPVDRAEQPPKTILEAFRRHCESAPPAAPPALDADTDPRLREKLRALGYVD